MPTETYKEKDTELIERDSNVGESSKVVHRRRLESSSQMDARLKMYSSIGSDAQVDKVSS